MGSVKDLEVLEKPTANTMGVGHFHFSDRYSIFDWGRMPDVIEGKGAALCLMGAYCFERLEEKGIKTHYRGLLNEYGQIVKFDNLSKPANTMEIDLVNVYRPSSSVKDGKLTYDYSTYTHSLKNCLIPLEIIYRNGLPEGSSVFKRLEQGQIGIEELGLTRYPRPGERFSRPIFDVSTKLEEKDRYLTWKAAQGIAGLATEDVEDIRETLFIINRTITQLALKADLENEDGKIELGFNPERRLMVVDVVGTLDECRFTYQGLHVSKEIVRQFYRKTGWFKEVEEAKKKAEEIGVKDWRTLVRSQPSKLDPLLKTIISEMYMAASNEITERRMFDVPSLAETVKKYRGYMETV
jgi:phosphoribosylaminoimidazole-succinocarboxamide synthase